MVSPDGLNRLFEETLNELDRVLTNLKHEGCTKLVLSGDFRQKADTTVHFSAGADLSEVFALTPLRALSFSLKGQCVSRHLQWNGWTTWTLFSGAVVGGGCDVAFHGHDRWGIEDSRRPLNVHHPALKHGVIPGFGGSVQLAQVLGRDQAMKLFEGASWNGSQALSSGAISRCITYDEIYSAVIDWLD